MSVHLICWRAASAAGQLIAPRGLLQSADTSRNGTNARAEHLFLGVLDTFVQGSSFVPRNTSVTSASLCLSLLTGRLSDLCRVADGSCCHFPP